MNMQKTYKIEVDCANCARKMEDAIRKLDGVEEVHVNFLTQKMILTADDARASYYLTQGQTDKLNKHGRYYDPEHEFVFIPSLPRLDVGTSAQTAIDAITARNSIADKYIEVFCHQTTTTSATNTRVSRFEDVAQWAASHGFSNGFLMDYFG